MSRILRMLCLLIIVAGCYIGLRYLGSVIHYACANPIEDCPPPINGAGQLAWIITGGRFVPLWRE